MDSPDDQSNDDHCYWPARCGASAKGLLIAVLALGFVTQTVLVYSDSSETVVLDEIATVGRTIWLENNCQACHQLHGFGGFLGPDLTNAANRLQHSQLEDRLALDEGQMPAFEMEPDQVDALWAFLLAMNETGTGQAQNPNLVQVASLSGAQTRPFNVALDLVIAESGDVAVADGFALFQSKACQACHVLSAASSFGAPDLTLTSHRLTGIEISNILVSGVPPKMPPTGLSAEEMTQVQAFLTFINEHRDETLSRVIADPDAASFWTSIPWWEY